MKLHAAASMMDELMAEHGLTQSGWTWRWGKGVKTLAHCSYNRKELVLYKPYAESQDDVSDVRNTILHEIAHALVGHAAGHSFIWKLKASSIGCNAERTGRNPAYEAYLAEKHKNRPVRDTTPAPVPTAPVRELRIGDLARVDLYGSKWHDVVGPVVSITELKVHIGTSKGKLMVPKKFVRPA